MGSTVQLSMLLTQKNQNDLFVSACTRRVALWEGVSGPLALGGSQMKLGLE